LGSQTGSDDVMDLTDVGLKVQFVSENEAAYYTTRILRLDILFKKLYIKKIDNALMLTKVRKLEMKVPVITVT
jgi:hypothetical protein